ncbi:MAG TPA: hypothetical protein VI248_09785 [Kineosporiaceae bacterium]
MKRSKVLTVSGVVAAATVLLTAVPASANAVSGGSIGCAPDMVVQISWTQNKAGYVYDFEKFSKDDKPSTDDYLLGSKGSNRMVLGVRSLYGWSLTSKTSGVVISHASANCVDRPND